MAGAGRAVDSPPEDPPPVEGCYGRQNRPKPLTGVFGSGVPELWPAGGFAFTGNGWSTMLAQGGSKQTD